MGPNGEKTLMVMGLVWKAMRAARHTVRFRCSPPPRDWALASPPRSKRGVAGSSGTGSSTLPLSAKFYTEGWQSLAKCAGLENRSPGKTGTVSSNLTPSAILGVRRIRLGRVCL